jgi:osmotically-inducible protein OsmY
MDMATHDHRKSDDEIQHDVLRELSWDTRIGPAEVGVQVHHGVVALTGTVSSWAKKIAAEEAAHRVGGVLDVANEMSVRVSDGAAPTDSEIAEAVRNALQWDVFVPDNRIASTVTEGNVTLTGLVDTYMQREDAGRAVRNLAGVRIVFNEIAVQAGQITPEKLREAIQDALERHADREAARLQIDIEGGRVTLRGNVESWRERAAVVGAVTGTRGVEEVVDRLRIA